MSPSKGSLPTESIADRVARIRQARSAAAKAGKPSDPLKHHEVKNTEGEGSVHGFNNFGGNFSKGTRE